MRNSIGLQACSNLGFRCGLPLWFAALSVVSTGCVSDGGSDGQSEFDKANQAEAGAPSVMMRPHDPVAEQDASAPTPSTEALEETTSEAKLDAGREPSLPEPMETTSDASSALSASDPSAIDPELDTHVEPPVTDGDAIAPVSEFDASASEMSESPVSDAGSDPVELAQDGGSESDAAIVTGCNDRPSTAVPCGDDKGDKDADGDGLPNCEDSDIDGDGFPNARDCAPFYALASLSICDGSDLAEKDYDKDDIRNCEDPDIDGDGFPNTFDGNPYKDPNAVSGK